ncbi:Asp23/Gls24 family envelope stress response protein [Haloimpatiens sp. FM7330]|uniref:Asp23/Gls24 family envelope stress response protein n=1 Tax=Haloimpatiens sp. FM7330 TaxID=3298610 RepID=UPI0036453A5D
MDENIKEQSNVGIVKISDEVVSIIAGLAASEIEGIAGISAGLVGEITQILSGKKNLSKGVKVTVAEESATIDLFIVVEYGVSIPEVCDKVQRNVIKSVETMTGLKVSAVNIYVQNVIFPKTNIEGSKEE